MVIGAAGALQELDMPTSLDRLASDRPAHSDLDPVAARAAEAVDGVSVVVPIHNEEDNLLRLHEELTEALLRTGKPYEIILVDDGSRDGSARLMMGLAAGDRRVKLVMLRRTTGRPRRCGQGWTGRSSAPS
jgi:cellulose synthase/poly-beta-1,6-N-acetylglucosamine synthase-like glycosyltransferase